MYRTKKDIDRHCQEIFRTIKSERERNFRCLSIAQQYYNVREYESAKRYVTLYLSTKDDSCAGHKLLAQCYEYFDEKEKALNEYKYALQLDPMQPELILRVCELLLENSVTVDISQIKYWLEKGEARFPYHPNIFKLKQKLAALGDRVDKNTTESIIMDQLKAKPDDPSVNCKFLSFLIENGRVQEAYMVAFAKPLTFVPTLQWYQTGAQICKLYKTQFLNSVNEEFFANYLLVLERTLAFSVQDVKMFRKCITECVMFLAKFDELLSNVTALANKSENLLVLVNHMAGQFCYHTAIILHRKVKSDENDERDVRKFIAPLLLLSTSESFIISTYRKQSTVVDRVLNQCVQHNTYRISQAGFVLLSQCKGSSRRSYLEKIFQFCVANWRERILEKVYKGTPDCRSLCRSSFFLSYAAFASIPVDLPNGLVDNVEQFVSATETTQPFSLHHLVWLGVQYLIHSEKQLISDRVLPLKFRSMAFESLRYAPVHSSTPSYAETLSKVDVDAFLYACVYCAESALSHAKKSSTVEALPADVSKQLCSPEQELWWESAYHMAKKEIPESSFNRVRSALQNGIELIRLVGQTNLPLPLVVLLGRTFVNKAAIEPSEDLASALEGRALLYWRAALPRLERIIRNEVGHDSGKSMLDFSGPPISKPDALTLLNEGKRFLDMQALKRNNYADLIVSDTISDYSEYKKPVQTPAGSSQQSNVEEENFSTLFDQNMKIMDRLEALTKKQEQLSTNQQQLHEMVSVLAKKIDVFVLDTLTQAAHPPAQPPAVPITMGSASQPQVPNFSSLGVSSSSSSSSLGAPLQYPYPSGSIQTNFPMFSPSMPPIGYGMPSIASYRPPAPPLPLSFTPPSQPLPPPKFNLFSGISSASLTLTNHTAAAEPSEPASAATNSSLSIGSPLSSSYNQGYSPLSSEVFANLTKAASLNSTPMTNTSNASLSHSFQIKLPEFGSFVKSPAGPTPEKNVGSEDDRRVVEHDPLPDFKPIIPLPDEITVTTGEENEEKLFETRAKLYRFADKEWKERGIGMFKVLKNRDTGRVRILMRREVVHKICANHFLTADMKLTPMMNSDRAWVYCAPDFSSEEMIVEKLCVKFKSPEIAEEFQQIFDQYKMLASASSSSMVERSVDDRSESSTSDDQSRPSTPDSSPVVQRTSSATRKIFFKPPSLNVDDIKKEETDLAPKSGAFSFKSPAASTTTAEVTNESKSKFGGFTFSSTPIVTSSSDQEKPKTDDKPKSSPFTSFSFSSGGDLFKPAQAAPAGSSLFSTMTLDASKATTNSSKDSFTSFTPSSNAAATDLSRTRDVDATATEAPPSDPSAPFASVRDTIDFSSLIKGSGGANAFAKSENFKGFAGAGSRVFTSSSEKPASSFPTLTAILKNIDSASASPMSAADSEANDSSVGERASAEEEFVPTAEFAPVVALPDLVEVKTGEEGLKVMYEEHCKLFRFVDKEWKERGIGKMKILLDPKNGNMRMLMRRDQVHKVCCNQRLTADIELSPMKTNNKAWTWSNQDYSEGELKNELFCIRFKTQELAEAFQQVFKNCQKSLSNVTQSPITNASNATEAQPLPSLAEQFKRDPNTWDCDVCYVRNPKEESYCTACTTPRQGVTTETPSASSGAFTSNMGSLFGATSSKSEFTFGMPTATVIATAATTTTTTTTTTSATASVFSFGSGGDSSKATATTAPPMVFSFGPTVTADTSSATAAVNPSLFSGFGSGALSPARFSFEGTDVSKRVSGGSLFGNSTTTNETAPADSKPTDNISVFSGNVIKPPEPTSTFSSFSFKLNDSPSFGFSSRSVVDGPSSQIDSENASVKSSSTDEVEFVSETRTSEEDKKLAESLQLPSNYFAYKYSDKSCAGCAGCEEEEDLQDKVTDEKSTEESSQISKSTEPTHDTTNKPGIPSGFVFGASVNSSWMNTPSFNFGNAFANSSQDSSSLQASASETAVENEGNEEEEVANNEIEPHFEPIVPLPDIIDVKTGEEDEEILFKERVKLFRYDEAKKEWKERGIGDMKLLRHHDENSYRLLLRREMVHKVVLNQRLVPSFTLQPLSTNKNSLCWFGMNFSEESGTCELEKLAVRFKTEESMVKFEKAIADCVSKLQDTQQEHEYDGGADADENNPAAEEYVDQQDYVDEQGIQDAMQDVDYADADDGNGTIFKTAAMLQFVEDDITVDYTGVIKIFLAYYSGSDELNLFVDFSTADIPSLYATGVTKETDIILENGTVTFPDVSETACNSKAVFRFENEELAESFYDTLIENLAETDGTEFCEGPADA